MSGFPPYHGWHLECLWQLYWKKPFKWREGLHVYLGVSFGGYGGRNPSNREKDYMYILPCWWEFTAAILWCDDVTVAILVMHYMTTYWPPFWMPFCMVLINYNCCRALISLRGFNSSLLTTSVGRVPLVFFVCAIPLEGGRSALDFQRVKSVHLL